MRKRRLLWIRVSEAMILGLLTGMLSVACALGVAYYLAYGVLEVFFDIPWELIALVPLVTILVMVLLQAWLQQRQYQKRIC